MEPFGTTCVVKKKPDQIKFYSQRELINRCEEIFDAQGMNLSVGMTRLAELLVGVPEEMRPVILDQLPGEAARVLASFVVKHGSIKNPADPISSREKIGSLGGRTSPPTPTASDAPGSNQKPEPKGPPAKSGGLEQAYALDRDMGNHRGRPRRHPKVERAIQNQRESLKKSGQ